MSYSKEWIQKNNLNIEWDVIIYDEIEKLELGHCGPLHCDGFKIQTICKSNDGTFMCHLIGKGYINYNNLINI